MKIHYEVKNFFSKKPCIYKNKSLYLDGRIENLKKELFRYNVIAFKDELEDSWIDIIINDVKE